MKTGIFLAGLSLGWIFGVAWMSNVAEENRTHVLTCQERWYREAYTKCNTAIAQYSRQDTTVVSWKCKLKKK